MSKVGRVDRGNDLGVMAWAVAPKLLGNAMFVILIEKQSQGIAKVH